MNNTSLAADHGDIIEANRLSPSVAIALALMTSLLAIMATGCNLVLILVIIRTLHLHTKTNAMLVSVAFSEFLTGVFVMPLAAAIWFDQDLVFSAHACEFTAFMTSLVTSSKSLGMLSLSTDRCLAVSHPLQYSSYITKTSTAAMVVSVWSASFVFALFPFFGVGRYTFLPYYQRCLSDFINYETFTIIKEGMCSLLPAVATVITFLVILFEARSHHRVITIAQLAVAMYSGPAAVPGINRYTRSTFKAMRTYIIITLVYLCTCFPMSLYVISVVGIHDRHSHTVFIVLTCMTYVCCVATPLIITTLSNKFKDSVKLLFVRVNRVNPMEKEAFTISTGLHSILETSMVLPFVPRKDSVKRPRDFPIPGPSGAPVRGLTRKMSMLPEIQSTSSGADRATAASGGFLKHAHAQLRKTLSYPS